jgi:hypothetical protein
MQNPGIRELNLTSTKPKREEPVPLKAMALGASSIWSGRHASRHEMTAPTATRTFSLKEMRQPYTGSPSDLSPSPLSLFRKLRKHDIMEKTPEHLVNLSFFLVRGHRRFRRILMT